MTEQDIVELDDRSWEKTVERGEKPSVVMFYSPTCAYCRSMEPYFSEYAKEFSDTVVFARVNIMVSQWIAERYSVRGTPTFKFFCSGKVVSELVGAVYPAILKKMIEDVLKHGEACAKNRTEIDYEITGYG